MGSKSAKNRLSGSSVTMQDAWELFEEALCESGGQRIETLHAVVDAASNGAEGTRSDRAELKAAAKAELARCGDEPLEDACDAVAHAERSGRAGWPNFYLAEAASQLGRSALVISCLARVPPRFFEVRDLAWRAARCLELEAMAHIGLGDWRQAEQRVDELAAAFALRGDEDDLAPPRDLVAKLLSTMPGGRRALETLATSLDLAQWVGPDLAASAHAAIAEARQGRI